jgi:hypothetical protein
MQILKHVTLRLFCLFNFFIKYEIELKTKKLN